MKKHSTINIFAINPKLIKRICFAFPGAFRNRKENMVGPGENITFSMRSREQLWNDDAPRKAQGLLSFQTLMKKKRYKFGKVTKYMGHIDLKDVCQLFHVCSYDHIHRWRTQC